MVICYIRNLKVPKERDQLFCVYGVAVVKADSTVKQHQ